MTRMPGALFVIDSSNEEIALQEAQKMNIPIVAIVDTNGDPENLAYPIPGNDDAVRAIELFTNKIAEAILEGRKSPGGEGHARGQEPSRGRRGRTRDAGRLTRRRRPEQGDESWRISQPNMVKELRERTGIGMMECK